MSKKKIIALIVVLALGGIGAIFLFRKNATRNLIAEYDADPDAKILLDTFRAGADPGALGWVVEIAERHMTGELGMNTYYKVNGAATKAGAFMSAYATSYYPGKAGELYQFTHGRDQFHRDISAKWEAIKTAKQLTSWL